METELVRLSEIALEYALRQGANEAAVSVHRGKFIELKRREGAVETLRASTGRGLSVSLFVDGRYSSNSTSLLQEEPVRRFIDETLAMTRKLAPDPFRALPDPSLYGPTDGIELDLHDGSYEVLGMDRRLELVTTVEDAARAESEAILSVTAEMASSTGESLQIHSNGFRGERRGTRFHLGATVTVKGTNGRRPEDHFWASARHLADLPRAEGIGEKAVHRALQRIGSRKLQSQRASLLVENRAAGKLIGSLLEPLGGASLQQRRSCFEGKAGQIIGTPLLTLVDNPLVVRGLGSRTFDDEGLAARLLPVITAGRLDTFFIDVYYGRKLGMAPTTGSSSNLILPLGQKSLEELIAEVEQGVLVTSFLGGNSNPATGDFSFGIGGHAIRRGKLEGPVGEMNITDSHLSLWHRLQAVGNDPCLYSAWPLPSLLFSEVQLSGI